MYGHVSPLRNYLFWFPFPALCVIHQFLSVSISLSLSGDILRITKRASGFRLNCPISEASKVCRIRLGLSRRGWGEWKEGRTGSRLRICLFWLPLSLVICTFLVLLDKVVFGFSRGLRRVSVTGFQFPCCNQSSLIDIPISLSLSLSLSVFVLLYLRLLAHLFRSRIELLAKFEYPQPQEIEMRTIHARPAQMAKRRLPQQRQHSTATKTIKNCTSDTDTISISHNALRERIHKLQELHLVQLRQKTENK